MARSLSNVVKESLLSPNSDSHIILLMTLTGGGITTPIRICDSYLQRLPDLADADPPTPPAVSLDGETQQDILYGTISRSEKFVYLPMQVLLPDEQHGSLPRASITMYDVTAYVLPALRTLTGPPSVFLELVMSNAPDTVIADFSGLKLASTTYTKDSISGQLVMDGLDTEPFPAHSFVPSSFPGLF